MERIRLSGRGILTAMMMLAVLLTAGCRHFDPLNPLGEKRAKGDEIWPAEVPTASPDASGAALRVGDEVDITFLNVPPPYNQVQIETIGEDGTISLFHDQKFKAAGKTVNQLQADIKARYVPSYYVTLDVNIQTPKRTFTVGGEVKANGTYQYPGRMDVIQAINMAQGLTDFAKHSAIELTRSAGGKPIKVDYDQALQDPKKDLEVFPGDRINVPRRLF